MFDTTRKTLRNIEGIQLVIFMKGKIQQVGVDGSSAMVDYQENIQHLSIIGIDFSLRLQKK